MGNLDLTPDDNRPPEPAVSPDIPGDVLDDPVPFGVPYDDVPSEVASFVEPLTENEVADKLDMVGEFLGMVLPDGGIEALWELTDDEVAGLAPPLTRVLNKRPQAVAVVQKSDEVVVVLRVGQYTLSRLRDLRAAADDTGDGDELAEVDVSAEVFPNE